MARLVKTVVIAAGLLASGIARSAPPAFDAALDTLRQVDHEGKGNAAAGEAWPVVAAAGSAALPRLLTAMDGANPLAFNWLRTAVDAVIADGRPLPADALESFVTDTRHDPRPRRLAYDLLRGADEARAARLLAGMVDDPSVDLRRDAVAALVRQAEVAGEAGRADESRALLQRAFAAARDVSQVEAIAKALEKAGVTADLARHFGFLRQWQVIGPFDNPSLRGYETAYPPEAGTDRAAAVAGKFGPVEWRPVTSADPMGIVDINGVYPPPADAAAPAKEGPKEGLKEVVAYAATDFVAPRGQAAELRLGTKNAWKVWLNGTLVFGRDEYHRGMEVDQYRLPVTLVEGRNKILVKLCQDDQRKPWTTEWEFQLRVCDDVGTAILPAAR